MQERQDPSLESTSTSPAPTPAAARAATRRSRRWLRWLGMATAITLIALCGLLGAAWWWTGQSDSLGRTLARVAGWMPADQKLEGGGIEGSLRNGGRIDWLRWSSPTMQVEIQGADIAWKLQPLLSRELHFGRVNMQELRIRSTPSSDAASPTMPLESLQLPVGIDLPVRIERVVWEGPPETQITELYGHYRYNGKHHALEVSSLRYAGGLYESQVTLQAAAPMQLQAQVRGALQAPLPNQPDKLVHITASLQAKGTLATEVAKLSITAQAKTVQEASAPKDGDALSADVQATVRPWLPQPLEQAQADLQHVDLALFMPGGPTTDVSGTVQAGPQDNGWQLHAQLNNQIPVPWDQGGLPVSSVTADAQFDGAQTWLLQEARITFDAAGDAHLQAQGSFDTASQALEGRAQLVNINPRALYSTLDAAPLSGSLQAQTDAAQQVQFTLDVQGARNRAAQALNIETARAQGTWKAPVLEVRDLQLQALQASITSPLVRFDTSTQTVDGQVQARMPGAQAQLSAKASPSAGTGELSLDMASAEQLGAWLQRLPLGSDPLAGATLQGSANAQLSWNGGWMQLLDRWQNPAASMQASGLQLNAKVQSPMLRYQPASGAAMQLQQLLMNAAGTPENLQMQLQTQATLDKQFVAIDTTLTGGLLVQRSAAAHDWQARIASLQARWSAQGGPDQAWQVQLAAPLSAQQNTTGNPVRSTRIQLDAGRLQITPPSSAGTQTAGVQWEPVQLRQAGNGSWAVQSKGRLEGVPLAWVDALSPDPRQPLLASAGVGGDLVVQGQWDVDTTGRQLLANVLLERASGDIRLEVEDSESGPITTVRSSGASEINAETHQVRSAAMAGSRGMRARVQDLRVHLGAQGNDLRAQVLWNTERAGQLTADVRSQIESTSQGYAWPQTAPISGSIKAALPNIGIWALFAPPGWRVGGTLNADVALSGTRNAPQWDGQLSADQLSVLSLLDGVDLKDGRLRARLQGTRLDITELFLQGGEGSNTRILGQSGNLTVASQDGGTLTGSGYVVYDPNAPTGSSGIRLDIRAVAQRLQVLVRADRQLSVSGNLNAAMNEGQVSLRGNLTVDRAAIMLADSSAPSLDTDVHVTSAATRQAARDKAERDAAKAQAAGAVQATQPLDMLVNLDLGNDFALQGYGIATRLEGQLQVRNGPSITGEIRTVNGRYRAWGQSLDVESGVIRFSGPYANPAIDIVALRPNLEVKAGVKVTGSANNPRVALFSEPDMSDAEKLSWVVMGRSAAAGGAETALLQQAALALLSGGGSGGNFAGQLGLDEVGLKGPSEDGEQGAAVTVGKRLSKDLYVAYEQSLNGAMGTLFIFYDLSRHLTLRGQTGVQTAVDLIYTKTKD